MSLFDLIPFLGKSKESDTVELMVEQMRLVYSAVENAMEAVDAVTKRDEKRFREKRDAVNRLEDESDDVTRKIEEKLYSGAFLAVSRGRILDFAEVVDDVADAAKDVVNISDIMIGVKLSREFDELLGRHRKATVECVGYLKQCVENINNQRKIPELVVEVRRKEHEVDTIAGELFHLIRSPDYNAKDFILISRMIEFMDEISDNAEDASDLLKLIMLMHTP